MRLYGQALTDYFEVLGREPKYGDDSPGPHRYRAYYGREEDILAYAEANKESEFEYVYGTVYNGLYDATIWYAPMPIEMINLDDLVIEAITRKANSYANLLAGYLEQFLEQDFWRNLD